MFKILKKTSRCTNPKNVAYHAVVKDSGGFLVALCGTEPGRMSAWANEPGNGVTCSKCDRKLFLRSRSG